jgi:hypothetical protein
MDTVKTASARRHLFPPSPRLPSPPPSPADAVYCLHGRAASARTLEKIFKNKKLLLLLLLLLLAVVVGLKREKIISVFNPQDPQDPRDPWASQASQAKPREEEGFFGLVPLVTHPSSIPLLGGLTPKFLSLSLHSL